MTSQRGFSLIEVLVVTLIIGILLGIAGPDALMFIRRSQSMGAVNEVTSDINMARSEAAKRRMRVVICSRQDDTTCGGASDWSNGYLVFADADADGTFDSGEALVKANQVPGSKLTLTVTALGSTTAVANLIFRPSGGTQAATDVRICAESGSLGRKVSVNLTGQVVATQVTCP